jgi:STE24 endopeptidase
MIFGGVLLSVLLAIMATTGDYWWILAWVALTLFSLVTAWLFPTFLAPLFNKFRPLEEGDLSVKIRELASAVKFPTSGVFVMDASTRSSHGNAYFTGIFGEKRIVLFDTLLSALRTDEIIAVLAHELGHFKLNHVRWSLIRGSLILGVGFFLMSLCLPIEAFYSAFGFDGISNYAALIVFSLWFGLFNFFLQPLSSYISRKNEFAADRFASQFPGGGQNLREALLKLREQNHSVPVTHPWYSLYYYSHPPIVERLKLL